MTTTAQPIHAAAQPAGQQAYTGPPAPPASKVTRRRILPPADAIRPHDGHTASMLDHVSTVEGAEMAAAMAWSAACSYAEALKEDRQYVRDYVQRHGELPDPSQGPLAQHPRKVEQLYAQAWRLHTWIEIAREDLISHLQKDHTLRKALDTQTDNIRDQIRDLWIWARDNKNRRALDDGYMLCDAWLVTNRLHTWAAHPAMDYQSPLGPRTFPAELGYLEWEADGAVNGKYRPEVPGDALRLPGAPPPATANAMITGSTVNDKTVHVTGETMKRGFLRRG